MNDGRVDADKPGAETPGKLEELRIAMIVLLDQIDYRNGACSPTDMVAAVLPVEILERATQAARAAEESGG